MALLTAYWQSLDVALTLQEKLYPLTGIAPQHQILRLYATQDSQQPVAELRDGQRTLAECGVVEWNAIKVCSHMTYGSITAV